MYTVYSDILLYVEFHCRLVFYELESVMTFSSEELGIAANHVHTYNTISFLSLIYVSSYHYLVLILCQLMQVYSHYPCEYPWWKRFLKTGYRLIHNVCMRYRSDYAWMLFLASPPVFGLNH